MKRLNFSYTHTNLSSAKTTRHCWPNFGYRFWLNVWTNHGSAGAAWAPVAGGAPLRANPDALPPRRRALRSAGAPCPRPAGLRLPPVRGQQASSPPGMPWRTHNPPLATDWQDGRVYTVFCGQMPSSSAHGGSPPGASRTQQPPLSPSPHRLLSQPQRGASAGHGQSERVTAGTGHWERWRCGTAGAAQSAPAGRR